MKKFNFFEKIFHKVIYFFNFLKSLLIKIEEFFIKRALIRKESNNFLFNFIRDNKNYLPSSNIQITSLMASRHRKIIDKIGSNRIKPYRWIMINNKIVKVTKSYNVNYKKCLNLGAGVKNPYALPLLWCFHGALSVDVVEPGKIDEISSIAGVQELIFHLEFNDDLYFDKHKIKSLNQKGRNIINKKKLLVGENLNTIINKNIIKTHNKKFENCIFKQNYFDFIYSRSTLEHVYNIESVLLKLHRSQNVGGLSFHQIDFTGHNIFDPFWFYYDNREFNNKNLNTLNGWRLSDYVNFYKKLGVEIKIIDKVLINKDKIKIEKINNEFKKYNLDDLRVQSAGIIVLKQ